MSNTSLELRTYYVTITDPDDITRRELRFQATDFGHAEEQTKPYVEDNEFISKIEKDYT